MSGKSMIDFSEAEKILLTFGKMDWPGAMGH